MRPRVAASIRLAAMAALVLAYHFAMWQTRVAHWVRAHSKGVSQESIDTMTRDALYGPLIGFVYHGFDPVETTAILVVALSMILGTILKPGSKVAIAVSFIGLMLWEVLGTAVVTALWT